MMSADSQKQVLAASEQLHCRVVRFAQQRLAAASSIGTQWFEPRTALSVEPQAEDLSFEQLALDIARFQREHTVVGARLAEGLKDFASVDHVPAVPADAFRLLRVAAHPASQDTAVFETSGTTGGNGRHAFRTLRSYELLSVAWASSALGLKPGRHVTFALAEPFEPRRKSSLGFMMGRFMHHFNAGSRFAAAVAAEELTPWLLDEQGVNLPGLRKAVGRAREANQGVLLVSTSFALVWLLDALQQEKLELPPDSIVLHTGGFKGRTRSIPPAEFRAQLASRLGVEMSAIRSEYGMTELSSQLYDRGQGPVGPHGGHVYQCPPWLRVQAVAPRTGQLLPPGEVGLARFVDLCNVDSALVVLTQDRVCVSSHGVELLGRRVSAPIRGCSLGVEAMANFGDNAHRRGALGNAQPVASVCNDAKNRSSAATCREGLSADDKVASLVPVVAQSGPSAHFPPGVRLLRLQTSVQQLVAPGSSSRRHLIAELHEDTGLSEAGIVRALDECLELQPSAAEVETLLEQSEPADAVHVVLPGRVFAAAYRALALATVSSRRVFVRPSRRQSVFARSLIARLPEQFTVTEQIEVGPGEHLWVYGSDDTVEQLVQQLPERAKCFGFGTGFGAVLVSQSDVFDEQLGPLQRLREVAESVARDVALFDQQGCLSPRVVYFEGERDAARQFALELSRQLAGEGVRTPLGRVSPTDSCQAQWDRNVALAAGEVFSAGPGWVSLVAASIRVDRPLELPVPVRILEVRWGKGIERMLTQLSPWLTTVGCSSDRVRARLATELASARVCEVGRMQRPAFDGPVDRRRFDPSQGLSKP